MEALVKYNYEAQESDELTIHKGDVIEDVKLFDGAWWEGTIRNKRGLFPNNFVKLLHPLEERYSGDYKHEDFTLRIGFERKYCRVLFSYEPCKDDELELVPEDCIEYLGELEDGWWIGRAKGKIGFFPSNFVSSPAPEKIEMIREKEEYCRVLFPYAAANKDELTLVEGDIIKLISKDDPDEGWWKGELNGKTGLFPDNFVEIM